MKIDAQKPISLVMALALAAGACGPVRSAEPTPTPDIVCRDLAVDLLKPPGLSRESVLTYPGGIVVNQAGNLADINININLTRINNDPSLGLSSPDKINIIYFFAGSLYRPDAVQQVNTFFEAQYPYLLARYCQEQAVSSGSYILSALSLIDAWNEVSTANPTLITDSPAWTTAFERELAINYIRGTRILVDRNLNRPPTELSDEALERALASGLPFRIIRINQPPGQTF